MKQSKQKLIDRWTSPEGIALRDEVLVRLLTNQSLDGLPLETHEGRIDLRGFSLPPVKDFPPYAAASHLLRASVSTGRDIGLAM